MKTLIIAVIAIVCTHAFTSCSADDYDEGILSKIQATEGDDGKVTPPPPPVDGVG